MAAINMVLTRSPAIHEMKIIFGELISQILLRGPLVPPARHTREQISVPACFNHFVARGFAIIADSCPMAISSEYLTV